MIPRLPHECKTDSNSGNSVPYLCSQSRLLQCRRNLKLCLPTSPSLKRRVCRTPATVKAQNSASASNPGNSQEAKPGWSQRILKAARVFFGLIAVFVACDILHFLGGSRPPTDGQAWRNLAASEEDSTPGTPSERRQPIIIYDRHKRIIAKFANSAVIALSEIPDHVWQSVVSAEDRTFFRHPGLDVRGLARAVLFAGRRGGGSTITQQLVKNLFVSDSKTVSRKVFEMAISLALEVHSTKTRILETYLQTAYFGHGAFGIGHAASTYYQKMPQNLSLNEAALLAATLPSPETLSPFRDPEGSVKRLQKVLKAMHGMGYLSDAQLQTALAEGLPASLGARAQASTNPSLSKYSAGGPFRAPFFVGEVMKKLQEITDGRSLQTGMHVYTTADLRLQEHAERVLRSDAALQPPGPTVGEAALVAVEPGSGAVRVLVGGRDYSASQYNRASFACRPCASVFKPVVYLAALERRLITPSSLLPDQPLNYARRVRKDTPNKAPFSFFPTAMNSFWGNPESSTHSARSSEQAAIAPDSLVDVQTKPPSAPVGETAAQHSDRKSTFPGGLTMAVSLTQPESGGEWVCTSTACPLSEVSPPLQQPTCRQRRSPTRSKDFFKEAGEYDIMRLSAKYRRQIRKSAVPHRRPQTPNFRGMASINDAVSQLLQRRSSYEKLETRLIAAYKKAHRERARDPRLPMYGPPVVLQRKQVASTSSTPVRHFYSVQQPVVPRDAQPQAQQAAERVVAGDQSTGSALPVTRVVQAEERKIGNRPSDLVHRPTQAHRGTKPYEGSGHSSQKNMWEVVRRSPASGTVRASTATARSARHAAAGDSPSSSRTQAGQLTSGDVSDPLTRMRDADEKKGSQATVADSNSTAREGQSILVRRTQQQTAVPTKRNLAEVHYGKESSVHEDLQHRSERSRIHAQTATASSQTTEDRQGAAQVQGTVHDVKRVAGHATIPVHVDGNRQHPPLQPRDQEKRVQILLNAGSKDRLSLPRRSNEAAGLPTKDHSPDASSQLVASEQVAGQLSSHRITVQKEVMRHRVQGMERNAQSQYQKGNDMGSAQVGRHSLEHSGPKGSSARNVFMPWRRRPSEQTERPGGTGVAGSEARAVLAPAVGVQRNTQPAADEKAQQQTWTAAVQKSSLIVLPQRPKVAASAGQQHSSDDKNSPNYQIVEEYLPTNVTSQFAGVVTARTAVKNSLNAPAVALAYEVGLENVRCYAEALGLPMPETPTLSMALGTNCVTPLQVAAAYATIAARGVAAEPFFVRLVKDSRGSTIFRHKKKTRQVARRAACDQLTSMLKDAFKSGTAASAKRFCPKVTAAAKTGTSDDCRDGWLAGYTGSLATVVWVGRDDNGSLSGAASRVAAPIWGKFMAAT